MSKKTPLLSLIFFYMLLIFSKSALAVCPLCTVAVGAGLGISRAVGIDDAISGIWIGGIIISSGLWMGDFVKKKKWKISSPDLISVLLFYILVVPFLVWSGFIGTPGNTIIGIDKILFGVILGSVVFVASVFTDKFLREINGGEVYIYYQKVILPVLFLTLSSYLVYLFS